MDRDTDLPVSGLLSEAAKKQSVIFNEDMVGGREIVTTDEEQVLR